MIVLNGDWFYSRCLRTLCCLSGDENNLGERSRRWLSERISGRPVVRSVLFKKYWWSV